MSRLLVFLALSLNIHLANAGLFGTTGSDDDCPKSRSSAWCLMSLAELQNIPPDNTADKVFIPGQGDAGKAIDTAGNVAIAAYGVGQIAGAIPSTPGFSGGFSGVMNLLSAFSGSKRGPHTQAFVLMPQEAVVNNDPAGTLRDALISAIVEVFRNDGITSAELMSREKRATIGIVDIFHYYQLRGGKCDQSVCEVTAQFFEANAIKQGKEINMPAWTGKKGTGYLWSIHPKQVLPLIKIDGKGMPLPREFIAAVSRKMPSWYYVYVPANQEMPLSMVLNQGEPFWFFKPGQEPAGLPKAVF